MPQAASQFSGIFISYRRDDSAGHAGRLFDRLTAHFGDEQIFMDIDHVEPGEDFVRVIEDAVGSCEILVALIGRSWLTSRDEAGRRLDNPNDFVRLEVAAALARGVRVIPVLVQGAQMPRPQDLPEDLLPLSRRHALELSDLRWNHDVDQLIGALEKVLARQREAQRIAAEEETERQHLEAEAQRQAEESERLKQAAAEAERQKQEAEEAERGRREAEEAERRRADEGGREKRDDGRLTASAATRPSLDSPSGVPKAVAAPTQKAQPLAVSTVVKRVLLVVLVVTLLGSLITLLWSAIDRGTGNNQAANGNRAVAVQPSPAEVSPTPQVIKNSIGMELVLIPAGEFMMGSTEEETRAAYEYGRQYMKGAKAEEFDDEMPKHHVEFNRPFYMGKYEVTQGQWKSMMGTNLRQQRDKTDPTGRLAGEGDNYPMYYVSWDEAQAFIRKLNELNDGYNYGLPSEAEWEYSARAGTTDEYAGDIDSLAWYGDNSGRERLNAQAIWGESNRNDSKYNKRLDANGNEAHEAGGKQPNRFGLYDMLGNVWEWCQDWYHPNYKGAPEDGRAWEEGGDKKYRVLRGCSWRGNTLGCNFTSRGYNAPGTRRDNGGFRVVAVAQQ